MFIENLRTFFEFFLSLAIMQMASPYISFLCWRNNVRQGSHKA